MSSFATLRVPSNHENRWTVIARVLDYMRRCTVPRYFLLLELLWLQLQLATCKT